MLSLDRIRVLDSEECQRVVAEVQRNERWWKRRGADTRPFHTLGAASYIDGSSVQAISGYLALAGTLNAVLESSFGWLHERVFAALRSRLGAPVRHRPTLALPGFHIWRYPHIPTWEATSLHFDLQYEHIRWAGADTSNPLSFTLPIALPARGGGLWHWDLDYARMQRFYVQTRSSLTLEDVLWLFARREERYEPGVLVVHSGHTPHQIAPASEKEPGDLRLTLQGHALYSAGEWHVYW